MSADGDRFRAPKLRRPFLGRGYRRKDVEAAFEELLAVLRRLDADLAQLRGEAAELQQELQAGRAELEAYRAREAELQRLLDAAERVLERAADGEGGGPTMTARGEG